MRSLCFSIRPGWLLASALLLPSLNPQAIAQGAPPALMPGVSGGDVRLPLTSLREGRLAGTLLQQYDFSCGSAALATLLTHHYGIAVSESTVFEHMFKYGDQARIRTEGFSLLDMKAYLKTLGLEADGFEQPLDKLVQARVPAIVLINEAGYQHFVVIKGLRDDRVLLGDPARGTRSLPRSEFEAMWKSRLLFVVHNRMNAARFNLAQDWRTAPRAPLAGGLKSNGLAGITLPKHSKGDF